MKTRSTFANLAIGDLLITAGSSDAVALYLYHRTSEAEEQFQREVAKGRSFYESIGWPEDHQ